MTKSVAIVIPTFNAGGAERIAIWLANTLAQADWRVSLLILNDVGPLASEVDLTVDIHRLHTGSTKKSITGLVRKVHQLKPSILFSSTRRINILLLFCRCLFPTQTNIVIRESNNPSSDFRVLKYSKLYYLGCKILYPRAAKIVCQSQYMLRDVKKTLLPNSDNLVVISNPVNRSKSSAVGDAQSLEDMPPAYAVACGRFDFQKGFDILVEAFEKYNKKNPDLSLVMIGTGPMYDEIIEKVEALGLKDKVTFLGYIPEPSVYFKNAKFLVSSSRWEGLPNVVLEAIACGTPVLATDCPGGTGEIIRQGENGWLVDTENVDALSTGIDLAVSTYEDMSPDVLAATIERFSPDVASAAYQHLLEGVLDKTGAARQ